MLVLVSVIEGFDLCCTEPVGEGFYGKAAVGFYLQVPFSQCTFYLLDFSPIVNILCFKTLEFFGFTVNKACI